MDLEAWWDDVVAYWASAAGQELLKDVIIPALAIVVSTVIAVLVLAAQLRTNRRQRRSELIAKVIERLADVTVEAELRHENRKAGRPAEDNLKAAIAYFDASISALRFALPKGQHAIADFVRNTVYNGYYDNQNTFTLLADTSKASRYFEAWVLGAISSREFRTYMRYRHGQYRGPEMWELWDRMAKEAEEGFKNEGGPAAYARYKRTWRYWQIKRRSKYRRRLNDRIKQGWYTLRHPKLANKYR